MGDPVLARATEIGYLSGGRWAATRTGLAMLHVRGAVLVGQPGRLGRDGALPRDAEPLEKALFSALHGQMAPKEVASLRRVREALAETREHLVELGLIRPAWRRFLLAPLLVAGPAVFLAVPMVDNDLPVWAGLAPLLVLALAAGRLLPRRTRAGARALRGIRRGDPALTTGDGPTEIGTAVALHGADALRAALPVFAKSSGLLGGGRWRSGFGDGPLTVHDTAGSGGL